MKSTDYTGSGYGDIASEYEETTLETFYLETEGIVSEGFLIQKILKDGTSIVLLYDKKTIATISAEATEQISDINEILLIEYI